MSSSVFPVPLSGIQEGIIAAKGDLIVGTANDTPSILSVASTAGYLLSVDSAETTGLKWAAPSASTPTYVGCNVLRTNVSTSLTEGAVGKIAFTSEEFDTDGFHDNSTNNTRITIPSGKGGKYLINAYGVNATGTAGLYAGFYLYKNNAVYTAGGAREGYYARFNPQQTASSPNNVITFSAVIPLVATDYLELGWLSASTETVNMYFYFQASLIGA
jgi:hypothetical protein